LVYAEGGAIAAFVAQVVDVKDLAPLCYPERLLPNDTWGAK